MTKQEILQTFSDINNAYNNCSKLDTLRRMLDELTVNCESTIRAIFTSYSYNRDYKYMVELCNEVNRRVCKYRYIPSDDGDIIYGFIILLYGEYGTSPRSGWLSFEMQKEISNCINDLVEGYRYLAEEDNV